VQFVTVMLIGPYHSANWMRTIVTHIWVRATSCMDLW